MHQFNLDNKTWTSVLYQGDTGAVRSDYASAMVANLIYVFGGWDNGVVLDSTDTICFNVTDNTCHSIQHPPGSVPPARYYSTLTTVSTSVVLYSGRDVNFQDLSGTWKMDVTNNIWTKLNTQNDPAARCGHTANLWTRGNSDSLIIMGGFEVPYNDVHILPFDTFVWRELDLGGVIPMTPSVAYVDVDILLCLCVKADTQHLGTIYAVNLAEQVLTWTKFETNLSSPLHYYSAHYLGVTFEGGKLYMSRLDGASYREFQCADIQPITSRLCIQVYNC